ncbi:hypothetical protein DOY81_003232 [Sarcophaga bullata]|nr:hypothetical protein DOY81_003232 [Sarcophaga bullata]
MTLTDIARNIYNYFVVKNVEKKQPNLGEDLRVVMLSSERQWRSMYPYLVTGLVAWPTYWLYRGYEWHKVRGVEPLPLYIRKTFFQAKMLEVGVLMTALFMLFRSSSQRMVNRLEEVEYKK